MDFFGGKWGDCYVARLLRKQINGRSIKETVKKIYDNYAKNQAHDVAHDFHNVYSEHIRAGRIP